MTASDHPWWKSAVFYQVYPRSFADGDGDGRGDLEGVRRRLDYLCWLGVDALWICPFYRSPMDDMGYDVSDYCDVDPSFGTLDGFDRLLGDAHERGLRVVVDWVPNHTSDRHPWFVEARSSRDDPRRAWYVWRDPVAGDPARPPNNWKAAFGGDAWTFDEPTGQWYLHLFLPSQPDLDWGNPEVRNAMAATLRFWLDRGVDGFRVDVVQGLAKHPDLPDDPPGQLLPHSAVNDHPGTHAVLRELRRVVDAYPGDRVLVGEVYLLATERVARYLAGGDQLHLAFDFTSLYAPWDSAAWRACLEAVAAHLGPVGGWPTWTLSNHDNPRHATRYGSEDRARAAAVLLLGLRGTPVLYNGEELALEDAVVPPERVVDPGGRDGCRAPLPWDASPSHGWGTANRPWLPWPPGPDHRNVACQRDDPASVLHLYRRLLAARWASPALRVGDMDLLDAPARVLAWLRVRGADRRLVMVNFTDQRVDGLAGLAPGPWAVEVASAGPCTGPDAEEAWDGNLPAGQALLLRPA